MTRPFAAKGKKRKKREENYDKEEVEQMLKDDTTGTTAQTQTQAEDEKVVEDLVKDMPGIPVTVSDQNSRSGAIFILEKATLEVAKVGKTYQILNSEDHANFLRKHNKNPADYRPDIAHQALLTILDSPLNKAGRVRAVYFELIPGMELCSSPLTLPSSLLFMIAVQLLQKLSITAVGKREKLFRVIKNPVTQYLPVNSRKIGFSFSSERLVDVQHYVADVKDDVNFVFVVGAMAHGRIDDEYVDDYISSMYILKL
ncbi:hypothetical protein Cgig2_001441 [Carnegiea gigantea]|uniref:Ribosomal RNA small subunit methyltransferase NEP1 n=1 Tax=Carnegiea gigantea TaxID=171969 RepID=A0A9Q1KVE9_9CARY|nr:hypothetical protein Cgig2_001441 [Carnegiea gigantea]